MLESYELWRKMKCCPWILAIVQTSSNKRNQEQHSEQKFQQMIRTVKIQILKFNPDFKIRILNPEIKIRTEAQYTSKLSGRKK
jgi:hypothetical protein